MIGRANEQKILNKMLQSTESEFVAVIGRRRVGKTYLIEEFYKDHLVFQMSGHKDFTNQEHMKIFVEKMKTNFPKLKLKERNSSWLNIFLNLIQCLESEILKSDRKLVVFFDELPWLCKQKSTFLSALGYFWNDWARKKNIVLVVCGSAASWMLSNIVKEKGSLYNRVTKLIKVNPFTLSETKEYLQSKNIHYNIDQLIQIYMIMGGIPYYLKEIEAGISAVQNIQNICFSQNGLLTHEYSNLYDALFNNSKDYKKIIEVLFTKKRGLTKIEISEAAKLTPNGEFYDKLEELVECGFVVEVQDLSGKTKSNLFRLVDEYSLFYHQFIKKNKSKSDDYWFSQFNSPIYHVWSGYAFENFCLRNFDKIIEALRIGGMKLNVGSFYIKKSASSDGAQIDFLLDRADDCINIIECKFYKQEFYLSSDEAKKIKRRKAVFEYQSKTKKQIFITLVTLGTLIPSRESIGLIDQEINVETFL
jgi:uncharacterized protein